MDKQIGQATLGELMPYFIVIGILLVILVFCFKMFALANKNRKKLKEQRKEDKKNGIKRYTLLLHIGGLDAPSNCQCSAALSREELMINCGGNEFCLKLSKIRNVDLQFDIDEKQYLKSSAIKGVAGAVAFGISGAIVGSAPKTKTKREIKCYAIISYENSQGDYVTFILRDEYSNEQTCRKLVEALKPLINTKINKVEL